MKSHVGVSRALSSGSSMYIYKDPVMKSGFILCAQRVQTVFCRSRTGKICRTQNVCRNNAMGNEGRKCDRRELLPRRATSCGQRSVWFCVCLSLSQLLFICARICYFFLWPHSCKVSTILLWRKKGQILAIHISLLFFFLRGEIA